MHHGNYHKLTLAGMLKLRSLMHAKKLPLNSKGNAKLIPQGLGKLWSTLFTKRFPQTAPSNLKTVDFNSKKLKNPIIRNLRCQKATTCVTEIGHSFDHMHCTIKICILNNHVLSLPTLLLLMLPSYWDKCCLIHLIFYLKDHIIRSTQREYSSKLLIHSIVKRILVFKR